VDPVNFIGKYANDTKFIAIFTESSDFRYAMNFIGFTKFSLKKRNFQPLDSAEFQCILQNFIKYTTHSVARVAIESAGKDCFGLGPLSVEHDGFDANVDYFVLVQHYCQ